MTDKLVGILLPTSFFYKMTKIINFLTIILVKKKDVLQCKQVKNKGEGNAKKSFKRASGS